MRIDFTYAKSSIDSQKFEKFFSQALASAKQLTQGSGKGAEFTAWLNLPSEIDAQSILDIRNSALSMSKLDAVVLIGIGGSYLGASSVIEALKNTFSNAKPEVLFAGHHLNESYYCNLIEYLKGKSFGIVVISKSGTTTEPAIAFRLLHQLLISEIGIEEASKRIIAITDANKGALKKLADKQNIKSYIIPDNVGGRYSVLTPVGLVPLAIAGIDIDEFVKGAKLAMEYCHKLDKENPALNYAAARNYFYAENKNIEMLTCFNPAMKGIAEWWKQLFGESEGKEGKGIFPASALFTTDLHSMGQYIQEGSRNLFETMISIKHAPESLQIPETDDNLDNLNYLSEKTLSWVNTMAEQGTCEAHEQGGVPVLKIKIDKLNASSLGELMYFFEFSCGVSAYMLGVNPFDQPGVEAYKNNMFRLLGKPK